MKQKIAIVGLSHRFPGDLDAVFWDSLVGGKNLVTQIDPSRWAVDAFHHPDRSRPGTHYTRAAGSIGDISGFDAQFFAISPREAAEIDPQHRILLELTWEALENAGIRPSTIRGRKGGVFIGHSGSDYSYRRADDLASLDSSAITGSAASIAANRISYFFDLRGPSFAVDTACSSAMFAFHQACQSIASGE